MSASYRKIGPDVWGIQSDDKCEVGETVTVTLKSGATKQVKLGRYCLYQYGKHVYEIDNSAPKFQGAAVGNLDGIMKMFDAAKAKKKSPAIVLSVPEVGEVIRINVATARAQVPGSLNVCSETRSTDQGRRYWYGRILQDGTFENKGAPDALVAKLAAFAADPVKVAAEHGKLTCRCCFCNLPLGEGDDKRSTEVGYGPVCAKNFGLAWG